MWDREEAWKQFVVWSRLHWERSNVSSPPKRDRETNLYTVLLELHSELYSTLSSSKLWDSSFICLHSFKEASETPKASATLSRKPYRHTINRQRLHECPQLGWRE
eukprot:1280911-Amphidinium_carterae.1